LIRFVLVRESWSFRPVRLERISQRACFIRMEKERVLAFQVTNLQQKQIPEATVTWLLNGEVQGTSTLKIWNRANLRTFCFR